MSHIGLSLIITGILILIGSRLFPGLGHLPGDLVFQGKSGTLYIPLTTGLLVSVIVSILLRLFAKG